VNFTPAADNKPLWFRFDLRQNPGTWIESDWIPVANKNAGSVTLTYTRGGAGIPGDWGSDKKQIPLDAQLVWGEGGRGSGALIGRKPSMFVIGISGGQDPVGGGTVLGTKPVYKGVVSSTPVEIPRGGPANLTIKYDSDVSGFLRLDLRPDKGLGATGPGSIFPSTWIEGSWTHITAGKGRQVTLSFPDVPADWSPTGSARVNYIDAQICWSSSGSGRGEQIKAWAKVFKVVESQTIDGGDTEGGGTTDTGDGDTGGGTTDTGGGGSTAAGISQWLKDNWMIALLIGALVLLVVPGRSSKGD
jgi:hypothetical protein